MQSISESLLCRLLANEILNDLQFFFAAGLKSAGIVENIPIVVCESEFVGDVMLAALHPACAQSAITNKVSLSDQPPLWGPVQPKEMMRSAVLLAMSL